MATSGVMRFDREYGHVEMKDELQPPNIMQYYEFSPSETTALSSGS